MKCDAIVIDDYAHHPLEIRATLAAIRGAHPDMTIICVFQPHTHDRTLKLWDDFVSSFQDANHVIIPDIYDARPDKDAQQVDVEKFVHAIEAKSGVSSIHGKSLKAAEELVRKDATENTVIITMGAGSITSLSDWLLA